MAAYIIQKSWLVNLYVVTCDIAAGERPCNSCLHGKRDTKMAKIIVKTLCGANCYKTQYEQIVLVKKFCTVIMNVGIRFNV